MHKAGLCLRVSGVKIEISNGQRLSRLKAIAYDTIVITNSNLRRFGGGCSIHFSNLLHILRKRRFKIFLRDKSHPLLQQVTLPV